MRTGGFLNVPNSLFSPGGPAGDLRRPGGPDGGLWSGPAPAQALNPCAFPLPVSTGLALGLALYVRSTLSGWGVLAAQVLVYWGQGAFAGSAAGWAAVYAARYQKRKGAKFP